jgi:hypothetical protein
MRRAGGQQLQRGGGNEVGRFQQQLACNGQLRKHLHAVAKRLEVRC